MVNIICKGFGLVPRKQFLAPTATPFEVSLHELELIVRAPGGVLRPYLCTMNDGTIALNVGNYKNLYKKYSIEEVGVTSNGEWHKAESLSSHVSNKNGTPAAVEPVAEMVEDPVMEEKVEEQPAEVIEPIVPVTAVPEEVKAEEPKVEEVEKKEDTVEEILEPVVSDVKEEKVEEKKDAAPTKNNGQQNNQHYNNYNGKNKR